MTRRPLHAVRVGCDSGLVISSVVCEGLTKHFGSVHAVDDLSFTVEPGEVVGFLGPNGAGKTTTIRALLDLIRPTRGRVEVLGTDPRRGGAALRRRIGYVAGDLAMYDRLTGRQLLQFLSALRGTAEYCPGRSAGRTPRRRARPADRHALAWEPPEDRRRAGVRARTGAPRARRADQRAGSRSRSARFGCSSGRRPPAARRCCCRRTCSPRCSGSPIGSPSYARVVW